MSKTFCGLAAAFVLALGLAACGDSSGPTVIGPDRKVAVNGTEPLGTMIAAGHYDWVNDNINTSFKLMSGADREETMVLVSFNRPISSENAVVEMRARNLHPADLAECLAYGAAIAKNRQEYDLGPPSYWIVCLGQSAVVDGNRDVPLLWGDGDAWGLDLNWWDDDWNSSNRFLAVRNN